MAHTTNTALLQITVLQPHPLLHYNTPQARRRCTAGGCKLCLCCLIWQVEKSNIEHLLFPHKDIHLAPLSFHNGFVKCMK